MSFVSVTWIATMWLTVAVYWIAPREVRTLFLMAMTWLFLAVHSAVSAGLIIAFLVLSHVTVNLHAPRTRNIVVSGLAMVGVLVGFKLQYVRPEAATATDLLIPLGLSYYTFRCLHFMVERYKGTVPAGSLKELAEYLLFLPTVVVGPIHRYPEFRQDRQRLRFNLPMISASAERILYGYVKIIVLSNFLVEQMLGTYILDAAHSEVYAAYLKVVQNGLNIYLQFSGYSDVAIGFAGMLGFRIIENFNWPYLKPNIAQFWRSWHISLSQWCRNYVFGPVVAKSRSPAFGAIVTMLVIALWHEISVRYVAWGLFHASGLVIHQYWSRFAGGLDLPLPAAASGPIRVLSILLTVHFVWFSFVIVTSDTLSEAVQVYATLLGY